MADPISGLVDAAFAAYEGGSYADWGEAAQGLNADVKAVGVLLDEVPSREPYRAWKVSALEIMLHLGNAVVAYDTGITDGSLTRMEEGNAALADGSDLTDAMNEFAAEFEADC